MGNPIRRGQTVPIQPGTQGEEGLSAYEVALSNGFEGSEVEWLASLATGGELTDDAIISALGFTPQPAGTYATGGGTATGDNTGDQFTSVNAGFIGRTEGGFGPAGWVSATNATALLDAASTSVKGLLSAADKTKLDAITGTNTGDQTSVSGNAGTATALQTARNINGVAFDGTANITINAVDSTARVPETRTVSTTAPLAGGGALSGNLTLSITAATTGAAGSMSAADKTKLDGIATSATANSSDATLLARANHTGSQAISTVTGLQTALDGKQASGSYLTANQTITLSGDVAGSGSTAITATLATVNSNVGTFGSATVVPVITVNGKGLVTAVTTATISASGGGAPLPTLYSLTAAHSNNTVTPSTIGNAGGNVAWTHTLVAGKVYRFTVFATYQSAALTTGGRMNLLGAGGLAGTVAGMMWGGIAQAAAATTLEVPIWTFANGTGAFLLTTAVNPINSPHVWGADFVFVCSTGGTLSLQWASEVAASAAQLNIGSTLMVELLN